MCSTIFFFFFFFAFLIFSPYIVFILSFGASLAFCCVDLVDSTRFVWKVKATIHNKKNIGEGASSTLAIKGYLQGFAQGSDSKDIYLFDLRIVDMQVEYKGSYLSFYPQCKQAFCD